jgi:Fe-S-cluster containining protein
MAEASLPLVVAVDTPYGARFAFDWVDGHCRHLDAQCRCRIHDQKPAACRTFHCSPRGGDGTETVRGTGFALTPVLPKV